MQEIEERIRSLQSCLRTVLDIYRAYEKDFHTREMGNLYETTPIYKTNGFKIGVGVAVVAGCAVLAVVAFPGVAVVTGAAVGSAIGAVSGGFIGGITAETEGGSFIDGFAEGMLVGAIGGAFSGAVGEATATAGIVVSMVANGVTDSAIYAGETAYRGGEIKAQGLAVSFLTGAVLSGVTRISVGKYGKSQRIESGSNAIDYVKLSDELGNKIEIDGYKIIDIEDAATANADWADMGYDLPPVATGTKAYNVEAGNYQYARVFKEGVNKPKSPFILRADDIEGLSASEIAEKYALPQVPDKIVYPKIPSETPLEVSIVEPQESWGTLGGDAQYAIKDVLLDDDWFTDIHDLK